MALSQRMLRWAHKSHTTKGINNKLGVGHAKTNDTNAVQLVMFFRGFKRNLGKQ